MPDAVAERPERSFLGSLVREVVAPMAVVHPRPPAAGERPLPRDAMDVVTEWQSPHEDRAERPQSDSVEAVLVTAARLAPTPPIVDGPADDRRVALSVPALAPPAAAPVAVATVAATQTAPLAPATEAIAPTPNAPTLRVATSLPANAIAPPSLAAAQPAPSSPPTNAIAATPIAPTRLQPVLPEPPRPAHRTRSAPAEDDVPAPDHRGGGARIAPPSTREPAAEAVPRRLEPRDEKRPAAAPTPRRHVAAPTTTAASIAAAETRLATRRANDGPISPVTAATTVAPNAETEVPRRAPITAMASPVVPRVPVIHDPPIRETTRAGDRPVHVTIGRVEIRAVTPPPTAPPKRAAPAQPSMGLAAYLRARSAGGR